MVEKWLISAVARAFEPGCDVQSALILYGHQGLGKSSFFRILGKPWFADTPINIGSKDAYQQLATVWIYEWAELEALYRAKEMTAVKVFLSASHDTYRKAYGRLTKHVDRRVVFCGSTNRHDFLYDKTGSRRFWVLDTKGVLDNGRRSSTGQVILEADLSQLRKQKEQLWAEATHLYKQGISWNLPVDLESERAEGAEQYTAESPLYEAAKEAIQNEAIPHTSEGWITLQGVGVYLHLDVTRSGPIVVGQITQALADCGYTSKRRTVSGVRKKVYIRDCH